MPKYKIAQLSCHAGLTRVLCISCQCGTLACRIFTQGYTAMKNVDSFSSIRRFMLAAAAFIIIIAGLRAAETIVVPFLLSLFIAVIASPALFWLQAKGLSQGLAMLIVVLSLVFITLLLIAFLGTSINDFSVAVPGYSERLSVEFDKAQIWLNKLGVEIPQNLAHKLFDPGSVMKLVGRLFTGISAMLANGLLIVLTVVFILFETSSLPAKLASALDNPEQSMSRIRHLAENLNRYIVLKSIISLLTGIVVTVWLTIIGVDFPILWGLLAFLFNFVPNIGSIIAAIPAVMLAFVQSGFDLALLAISGYAVINIGVGSFLEPRVMGKGLGLSTLVVFLSLIFWGWVLGPVGMLLSVPLTMIVKVILESDAQTRWFAVMLGSVSDITAKAENSQQSNGNSDNREHQSKVVP